MTDLNILYPRTTPCPPTTPHMQRKSLLIVGGGVYSGCLQLGYVNAVYSQASLWTVESHFEPDEYPSLLSAS